MRPISRPWGTCKVAFQYRMDSAAVTKNTGQTGASHHGVRWTVPDGNLQLQDEEQHIIEGPVHPGSLDPAHDDTSNCPCEVPEILSGFLRG